MSIDLSKISGAQYIQFFKDILEGTPFINLGKIIAVIIGAIFGLCYLSFYIGEYFSGFESKEIRQKLANCEEKPKDNISTPVNSSTSTQILNQGERCQPDLTSKQKADELQEKIKSLQFELNKKPSYVTCISYGSDIDKLNRNKNDIENRILLLLNPQLSQQQVAQGITGFTAEQLNTYAKLAAEYRKTADDIQKQVLSIQELRKNCE